MDQKSKEKVIALINQLSSYSQRIDPRDAENILMSILQPLLADDGYELSQTLREHDSGFDFIAKRPADKHYNAQTLGVEFKYYKPQSSIGTSQVRQLIGAALLNEIDRAILLVNTKFTKAARYEISRDLPLQIELVDLDALRAWVDRLRIDDENLIGEVSQILKVVSQRFAMLIAKDPYILEKLEWRDLERTVAEIFDGLGFRVELTQSSKDGGKDIVLECWVQGQQQQYIIEIKHWRSRTRVGGGDIRNFLNVIVREDRNGGLFLSTYGFCDNAFEQLSEIDRQKLRFGSQEKIVALCRTYVKAKSGIWSPPKRLAEVLFEDTA